MAIPGLKSYYKENHVKYHAVTEEECEKLILSALRIIEEVGMDIRHPRAHEYLRAYGCTVEGNRVRFPQDMVKKAIESAPSEFVLYDRMGNEKIRAGGTNTYFGNGPTNPFYNEFETNERRDARKTDVARSVRVSDACPNIDFVMSLAGIMDHDPRIADVCEMHEMLRNTTKPIVMWGVDAHGVETQLEMCAAVAGGHDKLLEKPFIACYAGDPVTPLVVPEDAFEKFEYIAKRGVPMIWPSGAQLGSVTPVTIADGIALGLAENLASLTMSQAINPGTPFMGGIVVLTVDMNSMQSAYGSPEHCLGDSIVADLYHYRNLPCWETACATDSKVVDEQAAIEASFQTYSIILSGGNMVHDVGFMDSAMTSHLDMIVMADEIISYARRIGRGVEITDEAIAYDVIKEVGAGGEFLTHEHTFENFREEFWWPSLIDRQRYDAWSIDQKDMRTRIHEKTQHILDEHEVPALPADVLTQLDSILAREKKRIGVK